MSDYGILNGNPTGGDGTNPIGSGGSESLNNVNASGGEALNREFGDGGLGQSPVSTLDELLNRNIVDASNNSAGLTLSSVITPECKEWGKLLPSTASMLPKIQDNTLRIKM